MQENESMASKGGKKAAENMTSGERKERAKKAAMSRWTAGLPKASHGSDDRPMRIGNVEIPCYVLDNGQRVITHRGLQGALSMAISGSAIKTASFVAKIGEKGLDCSDLVARLNSPIEFVPTFGRTAFGFEATVLADLCDFFLEARKIGGILGAMGQRIAERCELLARGFARVGIIALVDEATGYQKDRARDALAEILEAFIAKEIQPYAKTFPVEFYEEMFRLKNLKFDGTAKRPQYIGHYTNNIVYSRLAPGVLDELKKKNPTLAKGRRKHHHHRHLTRDFGHPGLKEHLKAVVALMKAADDWEQFLRMLNRSLPVYRGPTLFDDVPYSVE